MSLQEFSFDYLSLGAIVHEYKAEHHNIVLGFVDKRDYIENNTPHFGATIGRVANRVANGKLCNVNGRDYQLEKNGGEHHVHGGSQGFSRKNFELKTHGIERNGRQAAMLRLVSPDGDQGYPGTLEFIVYYVGRKEDNEKKSCLDIEFEARLIGDECEETVVNITNHSYFNLSYDPTIEGTDAKLETNLYLPTDDGGIPIKGPTPFPSRNVKDWFPIGSPESDFDDTFVMNPNPTKVPLDTRSSPLRLNASFRNPECQMNLEVHSTEPAFQFYTGQFIDVPAVGKTPARGPRAGFCIEPHRYVNAVNVPEWRNQVVLRKGQVYGAKIVYKTYKD